MLEVLAYYDGMTYPTFMPKPAPFRKTLGYYCKKCDTDKRLSSTRLCDCLVFEEDPEKVREHMATQWAPIYADVRIKP